MTSAERPGSPPPRGQLRGGEGSPAARAGCRAWACRYARGTDAVTLSRLVTLACAAHLPSRAALSEAVSAAAVGLAHGVMVLREFERLEPRLVDTIKTEALGWFVQVAAQSNDPAQIRSLRPRIVARYGRERELERELDHQRARRSLSGAQQVEGMSAYMLVLDPEAAARFEAALDPLSAPAPTEAQRDLRSAGQRRADALIALVSRAVTAGEGVPVQAKAQLIVSIPWNDLALASRGSGVVLGRCEGAVLDPETVRKIACDAQLIPMVLGADSEPLDVGRAKRLVPPGMLKALWVRDQGCTYPGCHAPPAWTDAHHIRHWADGGATALPNLTLVCARHHTTVHRLGATATVRGSRVHWNL